MGNKTFTKNSKIKEVLNNPFGKDIISSIVSEKKVNKKLIYNPIVKNIKLKHLKKLSKGRIDDKFIEYFCSKLNLYFKEELPQDKEPITVKWWKDATVYQIYPRSFNDSNNDGIGDIQGIIEKLDYLKDLGIDVIWLSPIYDSPNDDNGYDVRDYKRIMAEFGTMADFDELLEEVHKRGIRLIMDLVVNHTSDEHEWFTSALNDKDSKYRDYYIWRKGKEEGEPPNNWTSLFSGPAWIYDNKSDEWFLHVFSSKQIDLNWENKNLREDIYEMINWWLDKGIDGFRLDVINFISKEDNLPDGNKLVEELTGFYGVENYFTGPKLHKYLREMNNATFSKYDVVTVGETVGTGIEMSKYFTHEDRNELDMVFSFEHLDNPGKTKYNEYEYDLNYLKEVMIRWQTEYGNSCWNSLFYENHDCSRMISKVTRDKIYRDLVGKLLALIQFTLKGTPFIYQGQEIGMINSNFKSFDDFRDVESINLYKKLINEHCEDKILKMLQRGSRDNSRVPMQWNGNKNGGFTESSAWIGVNEDYLEVNVEGEIENKDSILNFYKEIIKIRKDNKALIYGNFIPIRKKRKNVFLYYRELNNEKFYIEINLKKTPQRRVLNTKNFILIMSNYYCKVGKYLRPFEANLYKCIK